MEDPAIVQIRWCARPHASARSKFLQQEIPSKAQRRLLPLLSPPPQRMPHQPTRAPRPAPWNSWKLGGSPDLLPHAFNRPCDETQLERAHWVSRKGLAIKLVQLVPEHRGRSCALQGIHKVGRLWARLPGIEA